ncbi:hypothetical protein LEM8419_01407 [Neolewinella maritima]|uniref:Proline dehydrogenase domain-containing protein n=1 Tax=Neolewinella maritima TaxID=1383882 RepID=A0ABM9AZR2_9BACT|nr:proline dehydrogenase family protein [Neolewinella maritima]CAH1000258.1 hypothetical protein LEM8419_01407 [Neolewinella maritima]
MKDMNGPVPNFPLAERARAEWATEQPLPDFTDTQLTFSHLDNTRLRATRELFRLMGLPWLTRIMGSMGVQAINWGLPGAKWMVKNTLYKQFVGGTTLEAAEQAIARLATREVDSILDYGAEGKDTSEGMQAAFEESLRATRFASETPAAIGSVVKMTSLVPNEVLEQYNDTILDFSNLPHPALAAGVAHLEEICALGRDRGCEVYLDAEESWIQHTIDQTAEYLMSRYNQEGHVVFTTCQLYRHDRLAYLKAAHLRARQGGYKFALKIVRGAYMVKERQRAADQGYPSPIQPDIQSTHRDFDAAAAYCLSHHDEIACCVASHNQDSVMTMLEAMRSAQVARNHPNVRFSQLLGMSGHLTFNLAEGGYNVSKYMVYGPVREVLPYLVRRAQENTSVTGEAGRELRMLEEELQRRAAL